MALPLAELERRMCEGKKTYPSRVQAELNAHAFEVVGKDSGLVAYQCRFCAQFHLGHDEKSRRGAQHSSDHLGRSSGSGSRTSAGGH